MNYKFTIPILNLLMATASYAQLEVETMPKTEGKESQTVFYVDIPQTNLGDTEKAWHKYIGKHSTGKASSANGSHIQLGAVNKNIAFAPFDVHSTLVESVRGVRLSAWLTQNGEAFITPNAPQGRDLAVKKYVHDFATSQYRCAVEDELKQEKSKLKDMEKAMRGFVKDSEKASRTISRNERKSQRTKEAMTVSEKAIVKKAETIDGQRGMVESTATDPNANKGANKTMDEMKDDKKDLQKLNEGQGRDLDDLNADTRAEERKITSIQLNKAVTKEQIDAQRNLVRDIQAKLNSIK